MSVTTKPELSCGLPPGPEFPDLAVLAESLGYARVWVYDSAPLWEDPFVHLALAAERTNRIGLGTAVLVPSERSEMSMATALATVYRISGGRLRACFGTGFTARLAVGQPPMTLEALSDYVTAIRSLLAGQTVELDGSPTRMLHAPGLAAARPIAVPLWLSVFGPKGAALASEVADGIIGPTHPTLPTAMLLSGTVLYPDEAPGSDRAREAIGPWRVVNWHSTYSSGGADAIDLLPGGRAWREALEGLAPPDERHLLTFEGHVTHLPDRDRQLLPHIDIQHMVGHPEALARRIDRLGQAGYAEIIYTPTGLDVARELQAMALVRRA